MIPCPEYRLRLFLSVDLAGSTSFKNGPGKQPIDGDASKPRWVQRIRHFYRDFPLLVRQTYNKMPGPSHPTYQPPHVWKTIGDEILLCCRVMNLGHLAICVESFICALEEYGVILDNDGKELDVKGAGWIAAFPAQNVTVALDEQRTSIEKFDEQFELEADKTSVGIDFLGNAIDCGFRVARVLT